MNCFVVGFLPSSLPTSCLTTAPRFDMLRAQELRRPLLEINGTTGGNFISRVIETESML